MKTLNGMIYALLLCSIALNLAQYSGKLASPQVVKLEQTDDQKLASIYGGM
jgi:hypothetical protein